MANILVVDDELGIRDLLSEILNDEGHSVDLAENATQARSARQANSYDLVLLDIWMPDTDGVSLLKEWAMAGTLTMPVIMMSGHATIDTAVEATRIGAFSRSWKSPSPCKNCSRPWSKAWRAAFPVRRRLHPTPRHRRQSPDMAVGHPATVHNLCSAVSVADQLPLSHQGFNLDRPLREARDGFEKAYFEFHLAREGGSMTRVAEKTGLERTHLYRKLRQLGVDLGRGKRAAELICDKLLFGA